MASGAGRVEDSVKHRPQAKDITDEQVIVAVILTRGRGGVAEWAATWDIVEHLGSFPPKVVVAKLKSCVRRGVIQGHVCSMTEPYCRGDFELVE